MILECYEVEIIQKSMDKKNEKRAVTTANSNRPGAGVTSG